jgi:Protein tyrosine and serine/threonine kinase
VRSTSRSMEVPRCAEVVTREERSRRPTRAARRTSSGRRGTGTEESRGGEPARGLVPPIDSVLLTRLFSLGVSSVLFVLLLVCFVALRHRFDDPLIRLVPSSDQGQYALTQISVKMFGVFSCRQTFSSWNATRYSMSLAGGQLHEWTEPLPSLCLCANCVEVRQFETQERGSGWPGYVYGGVNEMQLRVLDNLICLHRVELVLIFSRSDTPTPSSSSPYLRDLVLVSVLLGVLLCLVLACAVAFVIIRVQQARARARGEGIDGDHSSRRSLLGMSPGDLPQVDDARSEADAIVAEIARKLGATDRDSPVSNKQQRVTTMFKIRGAEIAVGQRVGKGSQGEVFHASWRGTSVAVKKLPLTLLDREDILREFNQEAMLMATLRHPNVLQFLGSCLIDRDVCIVSEFMTFGSLYRLLHLEEHEAEEGTLAVFMPPPALSFLSLFSLASCCFCCVGIEDERVPRLSSPDPLTGSLVLSWQHCLKMALDTAKGMLYLHSSVPQILHRDLKSHNLLVDEHFRVKISDFGLSKVLEKSSTAQTMTSCGTAAWAAPEVLRNARYTEKADVYSFGVVLWELWTRKDPYEGMPAFQIIFAVGTEGLRPTIPSGCPDAFGQLMLDCWQGEHSRRPSFDVITTRVTGLLESFSDGGTGESIADSSDDS